MKKRNYIFALATLLLGTACNQEEYISTTEQGKEDILFTATLQKEIIAESRALGENKKEEVTLPYVNNIRVRKVDINSAETTKPTETQMFKVRTGNYGTLDMVDNEGKPSGTAMKWTDKENAVNFYAWTVPTGVSINNDATEGTVDFEAGNKYNANFDNISDKFADVTVTPLEVLIGAYQSGKYKENPSVSLPFKHLVSKVKILVHWYDNTVITNDVTITFPYINKVWKIAQDQTSEKKGAFAISTPDANPQNALTLNMTNLYGDKNGRYFYLPPMTGDYTFAKAGDFEITYKNKVYYGSLADTGVNKGQLAAGEYMELTIDLNENFNAGAGAWIAPWENVNNLQAQADPYRGIYTLEGLKVLKDYLESSEKDKKLPDSLYIEENSKKIIRLYNDLTLPNEDFNLVFEENMTFDGLGHTITVPENKSLFGEITGKTGIEINNIRLLGAGQLASSLTGVTVYNCHALGTGNLVGEAKGTTSFDFCSAENSAENTGITLMGAVDGTSVTVKNSFVASSAIAFVSTTGGTITAKNSFIISTSNTNTYWSSDATSGNSGTTFTIDKNNVTATTVTIDSQKNKLIDLLNTGSQDSGNTWVYVYGKTYPVMRIK